MDIRCAVCSEPWDSWGANHGDMASWEYDLFRKGAGCPSCQGETPEGADLEDAELGHLRDVVFGGTDDPDQFERLHAIDSSRPEWKEPEPTKLWTCEGCGVSVARSLEAPYDGAEIDCNRIWLQWHGGRKVHYREGCGPYAYSSGLIYKREDTAPEPPYTIDGKGYCPGCVTSCVGCGESVFLRGELASDTHDAGHSFSHPGNPFWGLLCLECYEIELGGGDCDGY